MRARCSLWPDVTTPNAVEYRLPYDNEFLQSWSGVAACAGRRRFGRITSDGLRSCGTPHGRLSSRFRGWSGYPSAAAIFRSIPGKARWPTRRYQPNSGLSRPRGSAIKITLCPSTGCREMCPFPNVSSTSTELPAETRRTSPSLVSNSTIPSSHTASTRSGGVCQPASRTPAGTCTKRIGDAG